MAPGVTAFLASIHVEALTPELQFGVFCMSGLNRDKRHDIKDL